ncbi:MAG: alcohol dehydrogenase catalytic domain-containing protein [Planctomycetes bacterium]|nr:alcohol dehydrogenase catalytic domain-containing protein [Planctomycetota bacterium]
MKALEYRKSIPRYALLKLLGHRFRRRYAAGLAPLALRDIAEPKLPTEQWLRIAPHLAGICGSDISTISASGSTYLAPLTSMPFVMGHEVVGRVTELGRDVTGLSVGDRVVLHPALGCKARGIDPPCGPCKDGRDALCRNVTRGDIAKGIQTGYCRDTGGGFGENLVAHQSQVYRVPDEIDDRAAVLIEPFACALHGALRVKLTQKETALVIGCGAIGLLTIAALRAVGCRARIVAVAKYDHQREHALALGADVLLDARGATRVRYDAWARVLDAEVLDPELGKPTVIGGADVTFDCVASSRTIDDGLRFTKSAGTLVLVGMPGIPAGVDWTPMWFKELTIHAAYAYGPERLADQDSQRETFDLAIDLVRVWGPKLAPLVSQPYELSDHRAAFASAMKTGESRVAKTVFVINGNE